MSLSLAWEFKEVIPGDFIRNRPSVSDRRFPILGPQPKGRESVPLENAIAQGPYIYFVYSSLGEIVYIGKAYERTVLDRWARPDARNGIYQWSHGTNSKTKKSTIEFISEELLAGRGPVRLFFADIMSLRKLVFERAQELAVSIDELNMLSVKFFTDELEHFLIYYLQPNLNIKHKKTAPKSLVNKCGDYWLNISQIGSR